MHAFSPSTHEAEAGGSPEFEASLVYKSSSRTAKATQRNPVFKKQTNKQLGWGIFILKTKAQSEVIFQVKLE